ncbi:MAG: SDR family oxidoreductase [Alphaproteobacteria bacterium]|nr:SDR family oxidoreductase [Alphaproteobacteria bacterium]
MPTVLITGANRGLGLEFVRQYCEAGWNVIATCRDPKTAGDLAALDQKYPSLNVHALDVADFGAIDRLAADLKGRPIDVLLNNAGIFGPKPLGDNDPRQTFGHMDYGIWAQVLRINTMAPMKMAEAFIDHIAASKQKKFVAISSIEGSIARAKGRIYAYKTSKTALNMVIKNLAMDLAPRGVITAAFCPGWVKTRMGGDTAPLEAPPSIAGIRRVVDELTPENSGRFWLYTGEINPY